MRDYEVVYIFDSALEEGQVAEKLERYHEVVTGDDGGEITAVDEWGRRKLVYPINNKENGYYAVAQFRADPTVLPELERIFKLDDDLMRHMIVLHEGEPTGPESTRSRPPEEYEDTADRDEDEDEDEDEDDDEEEEE